MCVHVYAHWDASALSKACVMLKNIWWTCENLEHYIELWSKKCTDHLQVLPTYLLPLKTAATTTNNNNNSIPVQEHQHQSSDLSKVHCEDLHNHKSPPKFPITYYHQDDSYHPVLDACRCPRASVEISQFSYEVFFQICVPMNKFCLVAQVANFGQLQEIVKIYRKKFTLF